MHASAAVMEGVMKWIIQSNIIWFGRLLETEGDLSKRAMLLHLLAEQEAEMKKADETSFALEEAH
ncbi:MAG TPA: hypothetical protein VKP52_15030 [Pseudolabrys sp.]|nr:hypothetical protein [Pseudolabrys sp.]